MKLIDNPDEVRAEINNRIEHARALEAIYTRQIDEAKKLAEPYQRERWALESLLKKLDADPVPPTTEAA